jgi:hypothetical protein
VAAEPPRNEAVGFADLSEDDARRRKHCGDRPEGESEARSEARESSAPGAFGKVVAGDRISESPFGKVVAGDRISESPWRSRLPRLVALLAARSLRSLAPAVLTSSGFAEGLASLVLRAIRSLPPVARGDAENASPFQSHPWRFLDRQQPNP